MINTTKVRFFTKEETSKFLDDFNPKDPIDNAKLIKFFGKTPKKDKDGKLIGVNKPIYYTNDIIELEAGLLPNIKKKIQTTTGRYIFNLLCVIPADPETEFLNKSLDSKAINDLFKDFVSRLKKGVIPSKNFITLQNKMAWTGYRCEIFTPGVSLKFLAPDPEVTALKKKILKEKHDIIENNDVVRYKKEIEDPLMALAKKNLIDDPAWPLYARGGKPKFNNTHKNNVVITGPVYDPITKKYNIVPNSLSDGLSIDSYPDNANIIRESNYAKGVATQKGGAGTKYMFDAMQTVMIDKKTSDCKTTLTRKLFVTEEKAEKMVEEGRYIMQKGEPVLITKDNYKLFIGTEVNLRTPTCCANKKYCNICVGDYKYELGIENIGLILARLTATLMKLSLKAMHDITVKTVTIDPFEYFK